MKSNWVVTIIVYRSDTISRRLWQWCSVGRDSAYLNTRRLNFYGVNLSSRKIKCTYVEYVLLFTILSQTLRFQVYGLALEVQRWICPKGETQGSQNFVLLHLFVYRYPELVTSFVKCLNGVRMYIFRFFSVIFRYLEWEKRRM